jgi:hypothetical protein
MRRSLLAVAVVIAALLTAAGSAAARPRISPIGPDQFFAGLVNGQASTATLQMGCFGASRPGQMGHPLSGQTVGVQSLARIALSAAGYTGQADSIAADLYFPSPATGAFPIQLAVFSYYNDPAPISTSLEFPCYGSGEVVFDPVGGGPTARPYTVKVDFQGQP